MNIKYTTKWYLLRWALGFAYLGDGLAVVFTLGFCDPSFGLKVGNAFLTESERCASCPNVEGETRRPSASPHH